MNSWILHFEHNLWKQNKTPLWTVLTFAIVYIYELQFSLNDYTQEYQTHKIAEAPEATALCLQTSGTMTHFHTTPATLFGLHGGKVIII